MRSIGFGVRCGIVLCLLSGLLQRGDLRAAEPVALRYDWQAGNRYAYEFKVTADLGDAIETLQGTPILQVESVNGNDARVNLLHKDLASSVKAKNPKRTIVRFPNSARMFRGPGFNGHELTLDTRGRVINQRGESQLPFVLGNLSQLIVEPFPADAVESWTSTETTMIRINSDWPPRRRLRQDADQERLNAEEQTVFTIADVTPETVTVKKEYRLQTVETIGDKPRMEFDGQGEITFDRGRQIASAMDYKAKFIVREDNREVEYPVTVTYRLLTDAELAAHDEQLAAAAEALKAPPTGEQRATLLADLDSGDLNRGRKALSEIQPKAPADDQPDAELAAALAKWLSSENQSVRYLAALALEKWATPAEIPALMSSMEDESQIVVNSSMKALGRLHAEDAIEPMVEKLVDSQSRLAASEALKAIGADAEEQTLAAIDHADWQVRLEACRILQEIGTAASVDPLRKASRDDENALIRQVSKQAADAIEAR